MKKKMTLLCIVCLSLASCSELLQVASQVGSSMGTGIGGMSNAENAAGLKSALDVGIDAAIKNLGKENGFFGDAALKLLLPPEATPIIDNLSIIPGGKNLVDKAVLSLNRAAEDAVKEAGPIFKSAITNMSILDAASILFGGHDAATNYLHKATYHSLKAAFAPKVNKSLDKPLVGNLSVVQSWNSLMTAYNSVANSVVGQMAGLSPVNVNLGEYVTEKALDALFKKISEKEAQIRTNPGARVSPLLQKVFGQLDKK
ncbi:MAG: DUF4197 domain-containing protein [Prevotellaceae bacterium]|jgi:hypothetical protein|nr:DUF4197 domain-containing protein [Prevotellaceae bacterium]